MWYGWSYRAGASEPRGKGARGKFNRMMAAKATRKSSSRSHQSISHLVALVSVYPCLTHLSSFSTTIIQACQESARLQECTTAGGRSKGMCVWRNDKGWAGAVRGEKLERRSARGSITDRPLFRDMIAALYWTVTREREHAKSGGVGREGGGMDGGRARTQAHTSGTTIYPLTQHPLNTHTKHTT